MDAPVSASVVGLVPELVDRGTLGSGEEDGLSTGGVRGSAGSVSGTADGGAGANVTVTESDDSTGPAGEDAVAVAVLSTEPFATSASVNV